MNLAVGPSNVQFGDTKSIKILQENEKQLKKVSQIFVNMYLDIFKHFKSKKKKYTFESNAFVLKYVDFMFHQHQCTSTFYIFFHVQV